jgi:hypothetical protein
MTAACVPRAGIVLPRDATGQPSAEALVGADAARRSCGAVTGFTAEVSVAGRLGGDRVRGRLLVGFAGGGRARLEALAPFGQPLFVLVVAGAHGTVVLPRDRTVVADVAAADLLEAMTGVPVDGDDLAALLTGCVVPGGSASDGRQLGDAWSSAALGGGRATAYVKAAGRDGPPRIVAARVSSRAGGALTIGYGRFGADGLPRLVRIERPPPGDPLALDLTLSHMDTSAAPDDAAFRVAVPPDFVPIALDELRRAGRLARPR